MDRKSRLSDRDARGQMAMCGFVMQGHEPTLTIICTACVITFVNFILPHSEPECYYCSLHTITIVFRGHCGPDESWRQKTEVNDLPVLAPDCSSPASYYIMSMHFHYFKIGFGLELGPLILPSRIE